MAGGSGQRAKPKASKGAAKRTRKPGRPSKLTKPLAGRICERLADGRSLRSICDDVGMPNKTTVLRWLLAEPNEWFRTQYALARDAQADTHVDDMVDIADDARNDFMTKELGEGLEVQVVDHEHISRSKLRIETRKWIAARMAPKKYGDKLELGGQGDGGAITVVVKRFGEAPEGGAAHA